MSLPQNFSLVLIFLLLRSLTRVLFPISKYNSKSFPFVCLS
jgi:hypothetical protein